MKCDHCGTENKVGMKFCGSCGGGLKQACGGCGQLNAIGMKFCQACGTRTAKISAPESAPQTEIVATPAASPQLKEAVLPVQPVQAAIPFPETHIAVSAAPVSHELNPPELAPVEVRPQATREIATKNKSKGWLIASSVVLTIGLGGVGAFYLNNKPSTVAPKLGASAVSSQATAHMASPVATITPTVAPTATPVITQDAASHAEVAVIVPVTPTVAPIIATDVEKVSAKPKPSRTPKPTRAPVPTRQPNLHVEHDVQQPTEIQTPRPSGFSERFAACGRLDIFNRAACEVKLCFNNPSAPECKREPSVQDRQRR